MSSGTSFFLILDVTVLEESQSPKIYRRGDGETHGGKGTRRSAAGRRKEDARWMKLISKNEVISDAVRSSLLHPREFHGCIARRRYFNFIKTDRREDKDGGYRGKLSAGKINHEKSQLAISDARLRFN